MPIFLDDDDDVLSDPEALNTEVMDEAAASEDDDPAPEVSRYTARITAWDESPDKTGHQARNWLAQNEETDAEKLVHAGSEEAAREQRAATEAADGDYPSD